MSEITVSARKFLRIFDYIERIGLDVDAVVATVNLVPERIAQLGPGRIPGDGRQSLGPVGVACVLWVANGIATGNR